VLLSEWLVFYDDGLTPPGAALYWCGVDTERDSVSLAALHSAQQCIPVLAITDLYVGKTSPVLASAAAAYAEDCCLSILSTAGVLNLRAEAAGHVQAFLAALGALVPLAADEESPAATAEHTAGQGSAAATAPPDALLEEGRVFTLHEFVSAPPEALLTPAEIPNVERFLMLPLVSRSVLVFFRHDSPFGTLYWQDAEFAATEKAPKERDDHGRQTALPLAKITDIFVGRETLVFHAISAQQTASLGPEECCFSILSRELALNLQANSSGDVHAFLTALTERLRLGGHPTGSASGAGCQQSGERSEGLCRASPD
jgi:hypothetical protein